MKDIRSTPHAEMKCDSHSRPFPDCLTNTVHSIAAAGQQLRCSASTTLAVDDASKPSLPFILPPLLHVACANRDVSLYVCHLLRSASCTYHTMLTSGFADDTTVCLRCEPPTVTSCLHSAHACAPCFRAMQLSLSSTLPTRLLSRPPRELATVHEAGRLQRLPQHSPSWRLRMCTGYLYKS